MTRPKRPATLPPPGAAKPQFVILACVLVVVPILAVYLPICRNGFVSFDDPLHLHDNPHLNPPSWRGLGQLWQAPYKREYVPLSYSLFAAEAWLARLPQPGEPPFDPAIFHAGSLLLHSMTALAVLGLLQSHFASLRAAVCGALLFAVHPLQVESVAWISETRGLLAGLLSVLALWSYFTWSKRNGRSNNQYVGASLLFLLALLAKSSAACVPLIAWLLEVGLLRRGWRSATRALAPWAVLALVFIAVMKLEQAEALLPFVPPLWARPLIALDALNFYLAKLVWPVGLAIQYERDPATVMSSTSLWLAPLAPLVLATVLWRFRRFPMPWIATGIFVAGVSPVLGLVPFIFQSYSTVADRYVYLAMLGPALLVADLLVRHRSNALLGGCLVVLSILAVLSWRQVQYWHDDFVLYRRALEVNPRSVLAANNLAKAYIDREDYSAALPLAQLAVQLRPNSQEARIYLAISLAGAGRTGEAISHYEDLLKKWPENTTVRANLAALQYEQGRFDEAIHQFQEILAIAPGDAAAHRDLGNSLAMKGRLDESLKHLRRAMALDQGNPVTRVGLAQVLLRLGQPAEAIDQLRQALKHGQGHEAIIADRLARILATHPLAAVRNGPEAVRLAQAACQATHYRNPELLETLAAGLAESEQFEAAQKTLQQALALPTVGSSQGLEERLKAELALYRRRQPLREAGPL